MVDNSFEGEVNFSFYVEDYAGNRGLLVNTPFRNVDLSSIDNITVTTIVDSNDGIGVEARFRRPTRITSFSNNLFVADHENHLIREIDVNTRKVTTFAGSGSAGLVDGVGINASLSRPNDIAIVDGVLFVVEKGNHTIRKIEISCFGGGTSGFLDA